MNRIATLDLNFKEFEGLITSLDKIKENLEDPTDLNTIRARRFREYAIEQVRSGNAGLKPISSATSIISGTHNPEWNTGYLLSMMGTRSNKDGSADAGYFAEGQNYSKLVGNLGMGTVRQETSMSLVNIAVLQHTGYKIPLFGAKGMRIRKFLAAHRIYVKADKMWLIVPPRPFLLNMAVRYEDSGIDQEVLADYIEKILKGI